MGYHTEFEGYVAVSPPLNTAEVAYLTRFNDSRRWDRSTGPYDTDDAGYYTSGNNDRRNKPTPGQPDLWCPWTPTPDGTALAWDGTEKPYEGEAWMAYLINHFLKPEAVVQVRLPGGLVPAEWILPKEFESFTFNHTCIGGFHARGDEPSDTWTLIVRDNVVTRKEGRVPLLPEPADVEYTVERIYPAELES